MKSDQKICKHCKLEFPVSQFRWYGKRDGKKYLSHQCKKCANAVVYRWRDRTISKESQRNNWLIRKYGITYQDELKMKESQNYCCKICSKHESTQKRGLFVDHCHATGKVRGLLCKQCNDFIGFAYESETILSNGIKYLKGEL